ncbi:MAG TPA: TfoX/Sxy family protein [Actinomycetota bacterium]|nr:TfoX/Sxy family protein [Actinomycetota bacterium]
MAFDEKTADRVREILFEHGDVVELKMFGGIAFMVKGHMACGVIGDDLVARLGPDRAADALEKEHVRPMDFTGRPMKGYVFVGPPGIRTEPKLRTWVTATLEFVDTLPAR